MIMILDVDVTAEGGIIKFIARRAIHNPRGQRPRQTYEPSGQGPVNLKNLFPQPFYTTRGEVAPLFYNLRPKAATATLGLKGRQT